MSDNAILRRKVKQDFTTLPNDLIRDARLSWGGLGLLVYLLHHPDDFQFRVSHLAKQKANGRDATRARVKELKAQGFERANLYGDSDILGGLNAFYVLADSPSVYGLPERPELPQRNVNLDSALAVASSVVIGLAALVSFRDQGAGRQG